MIPLRYLPGDVSTGCRVGGPAPLGLESQFELPATQYFGTFSVFDRPDREFSLFHRFDPTGTDEDRYLISFNNQILSPSKLIWVVVHPISSRSDSSPHMFAGRGLELGSPTIDECLADDGTIMSNPDSKLGGTCLQFRYQVSEAISQLELQGYQHLLQIGDGPGRDWVEGFPWDPGFLNVWALDPEDARTYRFCVQQ